MVSEKNSFVSFGRNFIIVVNVLTALVGLFLVGGGVYVYVNIGSQFADIVSPTTVIGVVIAGFIVVLISLLGIYGAITHAKWALWVYMAVMVLMIIGQIAAVVITLNFIGVLESTPSTVASAFDATQTQINNFLLRSYVTCCVNDPAYCSSLTSDPNYCQNVFFCEQVSNTTCIDDDITSSRTTDPSVCTALESIIYEDDPLVGDASTTSCGGGDPGQFLQNVTDFLSDNILIAGYALLGLGIVELLIIAFIIFLLMTKQLEWDDDDFVDAVPIGDAGRDSVRTSARVNRVSLRFE